MGLLSWLFGATKEPEPTISLSGTKRYAVDIPILEPRQVEPKATAKDPTVKPLTADFSFSIEQANIKELAHVRIGDLVNFWAAGGPTRIYPSGGQGDWLGLAPPSYAKLIADHRSLNLPIEAEVIEKTASSCRIGCRLVPIEEVGKREKDEKDKYRDWLIKSYKPRKAIAVDFSFAIEQVNIEELDFVILGDHVNLWASVDAPTKVVIFRRGSIGGQGRLGLVPRSCATLIADQRSLNLPIETEVIEKTSSSCRIGCRLVQAEERNRAIEEERGKLRAEFTKPYRPKKPIVVEMSAPEAVTFQEGQQLKFKDESVDHYAVSPSVKLEFIIAPNAPLAFLRAGADQRTRILRAHFSGFTIHAQVSKVAPEPVYAGDRDSIWKEASATVQISFTK